MISFLIATMKQAKMSNFFLPLITLFLVLGLVVAAPVTARNDSMARPRGGQAPQIPPFQSFLTSIHAARKHLAAAAVARSVSIVGMYPMDTIKTRIQIGNKNPFRLSGLYGGVGGSLVGQLPYGVLTFGSYEIYKKSLRERFPNVNPVFTYAMAAVLGDLTGSGWLCPSEVVKQQMQAGMFTSTREALVSIWKQKGIAGLYQGYWGSVARDVPFRVAQLTSYEVTKSVYLKWKASRRHQRMSDTGDDSKLELSPIESALCGALAGTFSAAVTCPLDRIKTLLMTNSAAYGGSVFSCASKILSEEGLAGFTTGLVPRVVYIAPSVAVFFIAYEAVQQKLKHWS